jgi:hypothetical protein
MTRHMRWLVLRWLAGIVILVTACSMYACTGATGIGVGAPLGGAKWGGGGSNPGVMVMGGPVYR